MSPAFLCALNKLTLLIAVWIILSKEATLFIPINRILGSFWTVFKIVPSSATCAFKWASNSFWLTNGSAENNINVFPLFWYINA